MSDETNHETKNRAREAASELGSTEGELNRVLSAHGLHIVTEAEKRVLDAMADVEDIEIDMMLDLRDDLSVRETRVWEAEQARRRTP